MKTGKRKPGIKKSGIKKRLSLFLALCMLLHVTAVPAWAEQGTTASVKDNAAKTASSSNAEVKEEEKEVLKDNFKEDENEEEAVQTMEGETIVIPSEEIFADLPDSEELFAGYVEKMLYNEGISTYGHWGEERLEGTNRQVYDILKNAFAEIAAGERSSTVITIPIKSLDGVKTEWTAADVGMTIGSLTHEVMQKITEKIIDLDKVLSYLLVDCPYELYWYNKSSGGTKMGGPFFSLSAGKVTISGELTFSMSVANAYQGSAAYTINTQKAKSVQTAIKNAQSIVDKYKDSADNDKLCAYKDEICNLVSYNDAAADSNYSGGYGDPWQLIYVFDGDAKTEVVCEGYAKAFQYLCDLSSFTGDVICYTVTGMMAGGTGSGRHMWNIVTMEDNKNYLVDVTNCDEGTVGAPDKLFLAGASSGSADLGYNISVSKNQTIKYQYDPDMSAMYGNILTLANSNYKPKEDPVLETLPSPKAVYGQKLADVSIENPSGNTTGTWNWQKPDTLVGDVGSRVFQADFTPEDQDTYKNIKGTKITVIVSQKEVKTPVIELEKNSFDYTGKPITPKVVVKDNGTVIPDSEYTLSYAHNTDIGTASVTVHNKAGGNYLLPESSSKDFVIEKINLAHTELKLNIPEGGYVYDKTAKTPSVTVTINGVVVDSSWYKLSYAQNVQAGEDAQVTITAENNEVCTGTKTAVFVIAKKPVSIKATAENKTYDKKPDAKVTVEVEGTPFIEGDEVSLGEVSAVFTDIMPGEDKEIQVTAVLTGKDAANYEVKPTSVKATIHSYDPKEVNEAVQKAEAAKDGVQGIDQQASSVAQGTRFVSTAELQALNTAISQAKTAAASPLTAEEAKALADELTKATETFTKAIQTGTYIKSSSGSSGGGGGGGSRGTSSSRTNSSSGPASSQGIVSSDSKKGQVNSVSGILVGTTNGVAGDGYSHWQQGNLLDDSSWKLQYADGSYAAGAVITDAAGNTYEQVAWELIGGVWYAFGADGNAKNSWVLDVGAGKWYYVDINSGMKAGWIALNGLWYYLNPDTTGAAQKPFGAMYQNEMTPDGYFVNADGSWNGMPKN